MMPMPLVRFVVQSSACEKFVLTERLILGNSCRSVYVHKYLWHGNVENHGAAYSQCTTVDLSLFCLKKKAKRSESEEYWSFSVQKPSHDRLVEKMQAIFTTWRCSECFLLLFIFYFYFIFATDCLPMHYPTDWNRPEMLLKNDTGLLTLLTCTLIQVSMLNYCIGFTLVGEQLWHVFLQPFRACVIK